MKKRKRKVTVTSKLKVARLKKFMLEELEKAFQAADQLGNSNAGCAWHSYRMGIGQVFQKMEELGP